jgi:hypothetical protein
LQGAERSAAENDVRIMVQHFAESRAAFCGAALECVLPDTDATTEYAAAACAALHCIAAPQWKTQRYDATPVPQGVVNPLTVASFAINGFGLLSRWRSAAFA